MRAESVEHQVALSESFSHQTEVEMFEVAEPAMEHLGGSARCSRGVIALFHEADFQPSGHCVEGDPGPGDATPNHEDIESRLRHGLQISAPLLWVEG